MADYDVIIVGGGPAGLTAGERLGRAGHRVLLLERGLHGGSLKHVEVVDDHPAYPDGISGGELANELAGRAAASGLQLREADVTGIEVFSSTRWVACEGGRGFSAAVVVIAAGTRLRKLGVPGEDRLVGRGVIDCVPCDGALFIGRPVVVCGSDDHALADAAHLSRLGARVTLLAERGAAMRLDAILGSETVEGVTVTDADTGRTETLAATGVVIRAGVVPDTAFLEDALDLDADGRVVTDADLGASAPHVLAAGDVRAGSRPRVTAAIEDGERAAARAAALLAQRP